MRRMFRILVPCIAAAGIVASWAPWAAGVSAQQQMVAGQVELKVGDPAPDFTLQASDGQTYSLSKLRGKTVILAWFPKAFTAG